MKAVSILFLGLPSSKNIKQDYGSRFSTVSIEGFPEVTDGTSIAGVCVNGVPVWTVPSHIPLTVCVRPPLAQQGERIEVRCIAAEGGSYGPSRPPNEVALAIPLVTRTAPQKPFYGLTPPSP